MSLEASDSEQQDDGIVNNHTKQKQKQNHKMHDNNNKKPTKKLKSIPLKLVALDDPNAMIVEDNSHLVHNTNTAKISEAMEAGKKSLSPSSQSPSTKKKKKSRNTSSNSSKKKKKKKRSPGGSHDIRSYFCCFFAALCHSLSLSLHSFCSALISIQLNAIQITDWCSPSAFFGGSGGGAGSSSDQKPNIGKLQSKIKKKQKGKENSSRKCNDIVKQMDEDEDEGQGDGEQENNDIIVFGSESEIDDNSESEFLSKHTKKQRKKQNKKMNSTLRKSEPESLNLNHLSLNGGG